MDNVETVLRVERGQAGAEELAAVATVLLALRARDQEEPETQPPSPGWNWWKRPHDYAPPGSWR